MRRQIAAAVAALLMAAGITAAVPAPPASAAWGAESCANENPGDTTRDWRVCMTPHTVGNSGGGYTLDRVQVCAWHIAGGSNNFQKFKNGSFREFTGNGTPNGYIAMPDIPVGSCVNVATGGYKGGPFSSGSGASIQYNATAVFPGQSDKPAGISMPCCSGGA